MKAVCLANNHIMDYGKKGLLKTIENLEKYNIGYFGAGLEISQAVNPYVITSDNGEKTAIFAFGWEQEMCIPAKINKPGVAPLKEKLVYSTIRDGLKTYEKVIVNFHWGYEFEKIPLPHHRALAHDLIDMGVELIIGHHPHVVQARNLYKRDC